MKAINKAQEIMKKKNSIIIRGERIFLKILGEDDASEEYASWINDNEVNRYLETKKTTVDDLKKYIAERARSDECLFFGIFLNEDGSGKHGKHIGNIKLEPISTKDKIATMGMMIGEKSWWGKGIATEALNILVDWAFENLDIYEIGLGVLKDNAAAIKVYEKSGFKVCKLKETGFFMVKRKIRLALGTVQLGLDYGINNKGGKPSREKAVEILEEAYKNGIRVFDTAAGYGEAEDILGEFIAKNHLEEKVSVITKAGKDKELAVSVTESVKRLKQKQLDGLLLHDPKQMYDEKVVSELKAAKEKGLVRNIGASVYEEKDALYAIKAGCFDYVQIPYNVFDHHIDETDFFELAKKSRIMIIARSPFLQGLFLMKKEEIPAHLDRAKPLLEKFDRIISKHNLSRQEAALLFSYSNSRISNVLFGVDNLEQLEENLTIIKEKKMSEECLSELNKSFNDVDEDIKNPSRWNKTAGKN